MQLKIKNYKLKITSGFTLVELLVVVSIIGVLVTIAVQNFRSAQMRGRDAVRKSDLKNIQTALRLYYNDFAGYPSSSGGSIVGCGGSCTWGQPWVRNNVTYMSILPKDPLSDQTYTYTGVAGNEDYTIKSCLESKNDPKGVVDVTCTSGYKYEVKP